MMTTTTTTCPRVHVMAAAAEHGRWPKARSKSRRKTLPQAKHGGEHGPRHKGHAKQVTRRGFAAGLSLLAGSDLGGFGSERMSGPAAAAAGEKPVDMRALVRAFDEAMGAGADFKAADEAWTRAIGEAARGRDFVWRRPCPISAPMRCSDAVTR